MIGNRALPSKAMPSRIARDNASSLQFPTPLVGSGVIFGATRRYFPFCKNTAPMPFLDVMAGGLDFSSNSEWHAKQARTPSARYWPRASRSRVGSNFREVSGRDSGPIDRPPADRKRDSES